MGVSENSVPLNPMVLLIIIPMKNGYFIGNINPTFSGPNPHELSLAPASKHLTPSRDMNCNYKKQPWFHHRSCSNKNLIPTIRTNTPQRCPEMMPEKGVTFLGNHGFCCLTMNEGGKGFIQHLYIYPEVSSDGESPSHHGFQSCF